MAVPDGLSDLFNGDNGIVGRHTGGNFHHHGRKSCGKRLFGAKRVFNVSLRLLFISGLVFSSALWFGAGWLIENHWIRDARAYYSIIALAPAVFFVTFLASFRGYLQGWQIMMPTAVPKLWSS